MGLLGKVSPFTAARRTSSQSFLQSVLSALAFFLFPSLLLVMIKVNSTNAQQILLLLDVYHRT